jgi:hypothetical protein
MASRRKMRFVKFDEIEDVIVSLELVALTAPLVINQPSYWKWMIVGAQSALQGAMVCALRRKATTNISVLSDRSAREWLEWYEQSRDNPEAPQPGEQKLASFGVLLKRCLSTLALKLTEQQHADINRLHCHFRNNFAHFAPQGWIIERVGLPRIVGAALHAVEDLMGTVWMPRGRSRRLKKALRTARTATSGSHTEL